MVCFNSRTREGCDYDLIYISTKVRGFNSRTREGCDTALIPSASWLISFNSRTREGCDSPAGVVITDVVKFQFTHPGGVRQYGAKLRIMGRINKRNLRLEVLL